MMGVISVNIVLTGYRCTGKSTVGRRLAERLQLPLFDTDELIKRQTGETIAEIVEKGGWGAFRKEEKEIIRGLSTIKGSVIDTGGGVVMDKENRNILKKIGTIVWLTADIRTTIERMRKDENSNEQRPSLTDNNLYKETSDILEMRIPVYRQLADLTIDTSEKDIDEVVDDICRFLATQESRLKG
jgi:shikimate kinase